MTDMAVIPEIIDVIANVTGLDPALLSEDSSVETVPEWDSLAHLNVVLSLEGRFGVTIAPEQAVELLSVRDIKAFLDLYSA